MLQCENIYSTQAVIVSSVRMSAFHFASSLSVLPLSSFFTLCSCNIYDVVGPHKLPAKTLFFLISYYCFIKAPEAKKLAVLQRAGSKTL